MDTQNWYRWFAWHPVRLLGGKWVWLKVVQRRRYVSCTSHWSHGFMTFLGFCGSTTTKEGYDYRNVPKSRSAWFAE